MAGDAFGCFSSLVVRRVNSTSSREETKSDQNSLVFCVLSLLPGGENLGVIAEMFGFKDVWFIQDHHYDCATSVRELTSNSLEKSM